MQNCAGLRRPGAAALDLCYVAAGWYDGFFETGLQPWDVAAGSLMVTEAGGLIGNFTGEADFLYQREVVAGNPKIYGQLVQLLAPYTRVIPGGAAGDEADSDDANAATPEAALAATADAGQASARPRMATRPAGGRSRRHPSLSNARWPDGPIAVTPRPADRDPGRLGARVGASPPSTTIAPMHATLPLLVRHRFPAAAPRRAAHAAGQPGLQVQPELPALPRQCRPAAHRDDGRRHRGPGAAGAARAAPGDAGPDRRRTRAEPALPSPGARGARTRREGHRPLQPDHPVRAGLRRPGRFPGGAGRRSRRLAAVLLGRPTSTASVATVCSSAALRACAR